MKAFFRLASTLLLSSWAVAQAPENCRGISVDFVIKENDPEMAVFEDDIRADLEKIGITVNKIIANDDDYREIEKNGTYNIFFTRTWGAPYDPHTYLNSWEVPSHVEYSASKGLEPPLTQEDLFSRIKEVQTKLDENERQAMWTPILQDIHEQAMFLPLWGTRTPYVINRRLSGFIPSAQAYNYPIHTLVAQSGSKNVTVAPGNGGSLFETAGPITPHSYGSAMFAQDWVYEGLVAYSDGGIPEPRLAKSWDIVPFGDGQKATFELRENVTFHDGEVFNCAVAKLNFDHVLSEAGKQRHAWMGAITAIENWYCEGEMFVIETNTPFYPLLQELSYIRPLTFASPAVFAEGFDSDPMDHSSCINDSRMEGFGATCKGLLAPIGTGPFKFVSREEHPTEEGADLSTLFQSNEDYWGVPPAIEFVELKYYSDTNAVEQDLKDETLDMALGIGPLTAQQVYEFSLGSNVVDVRYSPVNQHALLVLNAANAPTDDKRVREAIIHAIDKNTIIQKEFAGLEKPVNQLLPKTAPYCDVDLTPKWAYDYEKAILLNCPETSDSDDGLSTGAIVGIVVASAAALVLALFVCHMIKQEKEGKPVFAPARDDNTDADKDIA